MKTYSKRLLDTFAELKADNRKALMPFITAGDPNHTATEDIMHALVAGGANVIELGVPFSDPAADGPVIQQAGERAIANGFGLSQTLAALTRFREKDNQTPVVLMGYLNPAEVYDGGFLGFANAVKAAQADAVILVDLSYESGENYRQTLANVGVDLINLVAPTTTPSRLQQVVQVAGGFVYYVSMRGITGGGKKGLDNQEIQHATAQIKAVTDLPVCIGFGINDGETAKNMAEFADGVVVGSALVKKLYNAAQQNDNVAETATAFMTTLRQSLDS